MGAVPSSDADLVGRVEELDALRRLLHGALAGDGAVALVSGEPGIGKTAVCGSVARMAAEEGVPVRWGRCSEVPGAPAFWPWRQVLGQWPEQEQVVDRFSFLDDLAREVLAEGSRAGLVVVLEDLHWADEDSLKLLAHLGRLLSGHRVLVVATYRSDDLDPGGPLDQAIAALVTAALTLPLTGLGDREVETLLRSVAPTTPIDPAEVAARADGNPFFVTQLARSWADGTSEHGAAVPHGARALIRSRLQALGPEHVQVLRVAAVIGRTFDVDMVAAVSGGPVPDAVATARRRNLVVAGERPGHARFVHALVREVLEQDLEEPPPAVLHGLVLDHLEQVASDDIEVLAARARHSLAAGGTVDGERATDHVLRCARADHVSGGTQEAIRLCRAGLAGRPTPVQRMRLLTLLGRALFDVDELAESERVLLEAADEAHDLGDDVAAARALLEIASGRLILRFDPSVPSRLASAYERLPEDHGPLRALLLSRYADFVEDPVEVEVACRRAHASAVASGDVEAVVQTGVRLLLNGAGWMAQEERRRVLDEMERALGSRRTGELALDVAAMRCRVALEEGALDGAAAEATATDERFPGLPLVLHLGAPTAAAVAIARGRLAEAEALDQAIHAEGARRGAGDILIPTSIGRQGAISRERDAGRSLLTLLTAVRSGARTGTGAVVGGRGVDMVVALSLAETGDVEGATAVIEDVLRTDLEQIAKGWGGNELAMACLLVQAAHEVGHTSAADRLLQIVEVAADRNVVLGMPPISMLGHGAHFTGLCHHLAGRLDDAESELERARRANRAMRAVAPLARTELALAAVLADRGDGAAALAHLRSAERAVEGTELDELRERVAVRLSGLGPGQGEGRQAATTTFVFTDIIDSTARTRAAGDAAWRSLLADHTSLVRALALRHGGRVVKGLGDGYMLTFPAARPALDFARDLQCDPRTESVGVRLGVHTGEAAQVDDDHIGHHVNLAARVAGAAGAGEVLVSETVHALVSAEGDLRFGDVRVERLKGVGDVALRPLLLRP